MTILAVIPDIGFTFPASFIFHLAYLLLCSGLLAFDFQHRQFPTALRTALRVLVGINLGTLALFLFWGSTHIFSLALPLLDSLMSLLSLLWLLWALKQGSEPKPSTQTVLGLNFALIITAAAAFVLWLPQGQFSPTKGNPFQFAWLLLTFSVLIIGFTKLSFQRPRVHAFPFGYLLLMALATAGELLFTGKQATPRIYPRGELLGLIAIALYALSFSRNKFQLPARKVQSLPTPAVKPDLSPALASTMLEIGLKTEKFTLLESLTHSLSLYLMADICGVISRSNAGPYQPLRVFDLIREDYIPSQDIPVSAVPGFLKADASDNPFVANHRGRGAEETAFLKSTSYNQAGNLLYFPISAIQANRKFGLLCASPYTQKIWGEQDLYKLKVLRPKLQQLLEHSESLAQARPASRIGEDSLVDLDASRAELQEQMDKTNALLATIRADKDRLLAERTQEVQLWSMRQRNLEDQVDALNTKLSNQSSAIQNTHQIEQEKNRLEDTLARNTTHLEQLKKALTAASSAIHAISPQGTAEDSLFHSTEANTTVSVDKSVTSSTQQRIESEIRTNANLFARQGQTCVSTVHPIPDLDYSQTVRLSRILEQLQRNACSASPNYGQVKVDVLSGEPEGKFETIEISITDYGGGLSTSDLQHFLKYISCNSYPVPVGIGDASALREAIDLVKSSGGHLWVNNPESNATAYRILLPVSAENGNLNLDDKEG
jgi:signal transduction histidine kinase